MKANTTENCSPLEPLSEDRQPDQSKAARLRTIQELVRSHNYHVPALLVAERMIQRVAAENRDRHA